MKYRVLVNLRGYTNDSVNDVPADVKEIKFSVLEALGAIRVLVDLISPEAFTAPVGRPAVVAYAEDIGRDSEPVCLTCMTPAEKARMLTAGPELTCVRCPADRAADFRDHVAGPRLTGVRVPLDRPYLTPVVDPRLGAI